MSDNFFFDPRGIERDIQSEVIPAGQYICIVDKVAKKDVGNSMGLKVYFKIIHGGYFDKVLMGHFNLRNPSEAAQRIGNKQFALFLDCIHLGGDVLKDETEIEGKTLRIEVEVVDHYKNMGEKQNKITKHFALSPVDKNLIKDLVLPSRVQQNEAFGDAQYAADDIIF